MKNTKWVYMGVIIGCIITIGYLVRGISGTAANTPANQKITEAVAVGDPRQNGFYDNWNPCWLEEVICDDEFYAPNMEELIIMEIKKQAEVYGVDPKQAEIIARCESSFNPYATNKVSTAKGLFQFTDPTWKWIKATGHQFDYKENIKQFMIWYQVYPGWWECE